MTKAYFSFGTGHGLGEATVTARKPVTNKAAVIEKFLRDYGGKAKADEDHSLRASEERLKHLGDE